jgi:coat protein Gp5
VANQFVFTDWVSTEALRLLINKLVIAGIFNTDWREDFDQEFPIGETVRIKLPQRFTIRDGLGYTPQPINRLNTTASINLVKGVDFEYDDMEKMLKMERELSEISEQYIEPAVAQIAQEIDSQAANFALQWANNYVGVLGVDPNSMSTFEAARQRMFELACPPSGEKLMIIPPQVATALVPALSSLLNPSSEISKQYKTGAMGQMAGFEWFESMSLYRQTAGTQNATGVTVNGAGQTGSTLAITCTSGDTFNQGDIFSIANVNQVNPMTRRLLSNTPKQFVVTAPFTGVGGGNAADVLNISPAIFPPTSQYQNVDSIPATGAVITPWPGTPSPNGKSGAQGIAIHRDAFALVSGKFELPKAVEVATQTTDKESGISIRYVKAWDPIQSKLVNRWDVAFGFGVLYSDNCAVRIACA